MPCVNQARKSQQFDQEVEMNGFETLNYGFSRGSEAIGVLTSSTG